MSQHSLDSAPQTSRSANETHDIIESSNENHESLFKTLAIKYLNPVGQSQNDEDADQEIEIEENRLRHRKVK